jgi:uncharacterized membrane protein YedE/YeeE
VTVPSVPATESRADGARSYANPYLAGVALGLVLLCSFLLAGRGLGVVGAIRTLIGDAMRLLSPARVADNPFYADERIATPFAARYWIVFEVLGLLFGAWLSARLAGRARMGIARGPRIGDTGRMAYAVSGGVVMGFGAALARGCTSGLALSGGALLGVGSWVFMLALFAGGYATAWFVRRQWT